MELLLKWVGGKKKYCVFIHEFMLKNNIRFKNFFEPFFGSGALTFFLMENYNDCKFVINDINMQLINFYKNVRNNKEGLISEIKNINSTNLNKVLYYELRKKYNSNIDKNTTESAALFYFINKTCFNGIYRVNSRGSFNTPCGSYIDKFTIKEKKFEEFSNKLKKCRILNKNWDKAIKDSKEGDLIYLDPPYFIDSSSRFIGYTDPKFDVDSYKKMIDIIHKKTNEGVSVLLSNSNSDELLKMIIDKFGNNFFREEYNAKRTINPKVDNERKKEFIEVIYYFKGRKNG
ncbi:DNA adenine methylase [Malacoplasma iowae]|uniref:DNA adenine methylase n=1 Tax=Malacoplasma iowae TaxID=2116 RepID=UPI003872FFBF|nr:Dam family site-specific DNA-(adenine-N6)-methyltransferase [Malacoplasma iowae]